VYLLTIIATISDPPEVAFALNISPRPTPINSPPKIEDNYASSTTSGSEP
tara:strand:- start:87 stop:236 length:150 start_codon:yes stop_codon:yes gene_type:complete